METKEKITLENVKKAISRIYAEDENNAVFENYNEYCKNREAELGNYDYKYLDDTAENLNVILNDADYLKTVGEEITSVDVKIVKTTKFKHASIYLMVDDTQLLKTHIDDEREIFYWDSIYHEEGYERKDYTTRCNDGITLEQVRRYKKQGSNVRITMMIYYIEQCKN